MIHRIIHFSSIKNLVRKFCSIHYFLMITLISILTLVMIFIGMMNYWQVYRQSTHIYDTELAASASVLNTIMENHLDIVNYHDDFLYQVLDNKTEKIILKSPDAPNRPITHKASGFDTYTYEDDSWRSFILSNPKQNIKIIVAMKMDYSFKFRMNLFIHDLQMLALIYIIISLLILWVVQKGLKALNHTVNEISKRDGENLQAINLEKVPLELQPLIKELNYLFSRVDQSISREKRFTADAAHELRTPLAALKTQVEVAKKELDETKRIQILNNIIHGTNRCTHVVEQLLTLSRLEPEAIAISSFERINLTAITQDLMGDLIPAILEKNIEFELIGAETPLFIMGKAPAIEILIRNLVSNAMNYTPEHGLISVSLCEISDSEAEKIIQEQQEKKQEKKALASKNQNQNKRVCLKVCDNGPGVPKELQERIFDRFFRELGNKQPGSGLGLSIVMQVVRLHRATIQARTPISGKGLEIIVIFPDLDSNP
jgi:two-component system sensor histidine kinase QseC